jgi:alkylmercury lyase
VQDYTRRQDSPTISRALGSSAGYPDKIADMDTATTGRMVALTDQLLAEWRTPAGVELIEEGAKIVGHLMLSGPLPIEVADEMLGAAHPEGMLEYFSSRRYELELDHVGRIVGAGLSLADDGPHVFTLGEKKYHGWCMVDALMFPIAFEAESTITTECPASGEPIALTAGPEGLWDLSPAGAWYTLAPAVGGDIREVFCDRVDFYANRKAAEAAVAIDTELACGPAAGCWEVAKRLADLF